MKLTPCTQLFTLISIMKSKTNKFVCKVYKIDPEVFSPFTIRFPSEFLVPVVFPVFKPFLLREKRVPPTLVIIRRLGFQSPFFTQIKTSSFHRLFFVSFPFFRRQNIKNFKKLNFLLIRACS